MIIEQVKKEIIVSEEFKTNSLKISEKSQEELVYNLIKNLYKNPISAIVKELVSNQKDAMMEVGNPNGEVIVEFIEENRLLGLSNCVKFIDFGSGVSPERFNEVYRRLGESTKRESNDYNGSFGAGSKSSFAYSETYTIETIHNNIKYIYIGLDTGVNFTYSLLSKEEVNSPNQTTVIVPVKNKKDLGEFKDAVREKIAFVKNVKFIGLTPPKYEITYEDDDCLVFESEELDPELQILAGQIQYPINFEVLGLKTGWKSPYSNCSIYLKFKIGELQPTLSREDFNYTEITKTKILHKLNKVKATIANKLKEELSEEKDFFQWTVNILSRASKNFKNQWDISGISNITYPTESGKQLSYETLSKSFSGYELRLITPNKGRIYSRRSYSRGTSKTYKDYVVSTVYDYTLKGETPVYRISENLSARKCLFLFEQHPTGFIVMSHHGLSSSIGLEVKEKITPYYEEMTKSFNKFPSYDEVVVPEELYKVTSDSEYSEAYRETLKQRKLEGKFTARKAIYINDYSTTKYFKFTPYEDKFENIKEATIIYGEQKDSESLLMMANILSGTKNYGLVGGWGSKNLANVLILKVGQPLSKRLKTLPSAYNIDDVLNGTTIFNKEFVSLLISEDFQKEIDKLSILRLLKEVHKPVYDSFQYCRGLVNSNSFNCLRGTSQEKVREIVNSNNLKDEVFVEELNKIKEFMKDLDLLYYVEEDSKAVPFITDFLKLKNKI